MSYIYIYRDIPIKRLIKNVGLQINSSGVFWGPHLRVPQSASALSQDTEMNHVYYNSRLGKSKEWGFSTRHMIRLDSWVLISPEQSERRKKGSLDEMEMFPLLLGWMRGLDATSQAKWELCTAFTTLSFCPQYAHISQREILDNYFKFTLFCQKHLT